MFRFRMFTVIAGGILSVVSVLYTAAQCRAEYLVNDFTKGKQLDPDVAINAAGDYVVVWESEYQDGNRYGIFGRRYDAAGLALGGSFQINSTTAGTQADPAIAMDPAGNFVVAWHSPDGDDEGVFARRFDAGGIPLAPEYRVNTYTTSRQIQPEIAMNDSGDYAIVWQSNLRPDDGTHLAEWNVCGRAYDSSGAPRSAEFTVSQEFQGQSPTVAMDDSGNFSVVYNLDTQVRMRQYNADGIAKDDAIALSGYLGHAMGPQIAMNGSGNIVTAWTENPNNNNYRENDIHLQRYNPDGIVAGAELVPHTNLEGLQTGQAIAMNDAGESVVIWADFERGASVSGRLYGGDGSPLGDEFPLSSFTDASGAALMNVAMNDNGQYVAVWNSDGQDGDRYGIFAQNGTVVVPEPTSISLMLVGGLTLLVTFMRRNTRRRGEA
jgi:hypothetical protein